MVWLSSKPVRQASQVLISGRILCSPIDAAMIRPPNESGDPKEVMPRRKTQPASSPLPSSHTGPQAESKVLCSPIDVAIMRLLDESGDPKEILHRRKTAFKVIPRIPEGSWVIKQAVGSTPVLLGNKLTTHFYR